MAHYFMQQSGDKNTSKLHVTGLCKGNSPVTGEFPAQRASNTENVSFWWRQRFCHFGGDLRWFHWMMSLDNFQCVPWREPHVGITTFSFQWITNEFLMKSHIYWCLKCYPFLWSYCDQIVFSYFMCTLSQILFLSISLLLGSFRYVSNIFIVLTCIVSICRF